MENKPKHYLDKDYIIQNIVVKYRTVSAFVREYGISRTRLYEILNAGYVKKNAIAVVALSKYLKLPQNAIWRK